MYYTKGNRMDCSYGIIFLNENRQLLLCHVTGHPHWDIPKGGGEPNETAFESATRECLEETGIVVTKEQIVFEITRRKYSKRKDLHTFIVETHTSNIDLKNLVCKSMFVDEKTQTEKPEVDDYRWMAFHEAIAHCSHNMKIYLPNALELYATATREKMWSLQNQYR